MRVTFRKHGMVIMSVIVAVVILATAYIANGSEYETAWLYIVALWLVILPVWEIYSKKKNKSK